jgi:hypothetical protein
MWEINLICKPEDPRRLGSWQLQALLEVEVRMQELKLEELVEGLFMKQSQLPKSMQPDDCLSHIVRKRWERGTPRTGRDC